jgi:HK97 family phage prohead protease
VEYKKLPFFTKSIDEESRTVTGVFAVHGNMDDGRDISINGAFGKRLNDGQRKRVRFLWNHDGYSPPIASLKAIREVGREELPEKVLAWAPEATGGALVTRQYYKGVPLADWVFQAIVAGDITEMSYAYDVHEYERQKREGEEREVRILKDIELYDISDVNWGMNPATAGVKGFPVAGMTFTQHSEWVATTLSEYVKRVQDRKAFRDQEERKLSDAVVERLSQMQAEVAAILNECSTKASDEEVQKVLTHYLRFEAQYQGVNLR